MIDLIALDVDNWFKNNYHNKLSGRRIIYDQIAVSLNDLLSDLKLMKLGNSFQELPINSVDIGNGKIKVLLWSQMHDNKSTINNAVYQSKRTDIGFLFKEVVKNSVLIFMNKNEIINYIKKNT